MVRNLALLIALVLAIIAISTAMAKSPPGPKIPDFTSTQCK